MKTTFIDFLTEKTSTIAKEKSIDIDKQNFSKRYWNMFIAYCKENIYKILEDIDMYSYSYFKIKDLHIALTVDFTFNSLGEYDDVTNTMTISFYSIFQQFLKNVDELNDLTNYEEKLISDGIELILLVNVKDVNNDFINIEQAKKANEDIRETFIHEVTHHYDAVKYGKGYSKFADKLEDKRATIGEKKGKKEEKSFYVNMPHEINARIISGLDKLITKHGKKFENFSLFFDTFLKYFTHYDKLTEINKRKVNKRLYKYFIENIKTNKKLSEVS